jgi:hypothetical protein
VTYPSSALLGPITSPEEHQKVTILHLAHLQFFNCPEVFTQPGDLLDGVKV